MRSAHQNNHPKLYPHGVFGITKPEPESEAGECVTATSTMVYISQKVTVQGLILLLLSVHLATPDDRKWIIFGENEYFLPPEKKTFTESRKSCKEYGGKLNAPKSEKEHNFTLKWVNPKKLETWVNIVCHEDRWRYENGSEIAWTHWKPDQAIAECLNNTRWYAAVSSVENYWKPVKDPKTERRYICDRDRRQYFKVKPNDTSVTEGQTAILHCSVGFEKDQKENPKVKWYRFNDGTYLGHSSRDPNITGWPRHSMHVSVDWDEEEGQFDLVIKNTNSNDTGTYDCEVAATDNHGGFFNVLHANASLIVKVKVPGNPGLPGTTGTPGIPGTQGIPGTSGTVAYDSTKSQGNAFNLSWLVVAAIVMAVISGWW